MLTWQETPLIIAQLLVMLFFLVPPLFLGLLRYNPLYLDPPPKLSIILLHILLLMFIGFDNYYMLSTFFSLNLLCYVVIMSLLSLLPTIPVSMFLHDTLRLIITLFVRRFQGRIFRFTLSPPTIRLRTCSQSHSQHIPSSIVVANS